MKARVAISDLMDIFRSGLLALIPVAERAGIAWHGETYDPWEEIEDALFRSFIASVVDNMAPTASRPLAKYSLSYPTYAGCSFVGERTQRLGGEHVAFEALTTTSEPFDTCRFCVIGQDLVPTGRSIDIPFAEAASELAANFGDRIEHKESVDYEE
jgi:hypothetical protein